MNKPLYTKVALNKLIGLVVRQAHHQRNQSFVVRPEPVEGLIPSFLKCLVPATLLLSLAGCIGGSTPPARFFLLEPVPASAANGVANDAPKPVIALAPVRIPRYVDRAQIVTATGKNAYQLSELNRWAEALDQNLTRVLAQDLAILVPAEVLQSNASNRAQQALLRVVVTVLEFHVDPQGQAGLTAQWQISRGDSLVMSRQDSYREPASTNDYPQMVAALNECLNRLSRDLAAAIKTAASSVQ